MQIKVINTDAQRLVALGFEVLWDIQFTKDFERSKIVSRQVKAIVNPKVNMINILICF